MLLSRLLALPLPVLALADAQTSTAVGDYIRAGLGLTTSPVDVLVPSGNGTGHHRNTTFARNSSTSDASTSTGGSSLFQDAVDSSTTLHFPSIAPTSPLTSGSEAHTPTTSPPSTSASSSLHLTKFIISSTKSASVSQGLASDFSTSSKLIVVPLNRTSTAVHAITATDKASLKALQVANATNSVSIDGVNNSSTASTANTTAVTRSKSFNATSRSVALLGTGMTLLNSSFAATSVSISSTTSIAPTGTGSDYASACNSLWYSYSLASTWWQWFDWETVTTTQTYTYTSYTAPITTLCDGFPRVVGTLTSVGVATNTTIITTSTPPASTIPTPACSISPSDCLGLFSTYSSAWSAFTSDFEVTTTVSLSPDGLTLLVDNATTVYSSFPATITVDSITYPPEYSTYEDSSFLGFTSNSYEYSTYTTSTLLYNFSGEYLYQNYAIELSDVDTWPQNLIPRCTAPTNDSSICGQCVISGNGVQLLYFPASSASSSVPCAATYTPAELITCPLGPTTALYSAGTADIIGICESVSNCPYMASNTTAANSGPYFVSAGKTYYANRAYLSIEEVFATNACGQVGQRHSGNVITLASTQVFSTPLLDGGSPRGSLATCADAGASFNFGQVYPGAVSSVEYFNNVNANVPGGCSVAPGFNEGTEATQSWCTDFFNGNNDCDIWCNTIYDLAYNPVLLVPTQVRDLDPAWASCQPALEGLYDPPMPLTEALTEASPTLPARPGSTVPSSQPVATAVKETTKHSTFTAKDASSSSSPVRQASATHNSSPHGSSSGQPKNAQQGPSPGTEGSNQGTGQGGAGQANGGSGQAIGGDVDAGNSGNDDSSDSAAGLDSGPASIVFTANGQTHTAIAAPAGGMVIDGAITIYNGDPATVGGMTLSVDGQKLIADGTTMEMDGSSPSLQTTFMINGVVHTESWVAGATNVAVVDGSTVMFGSGLTKINGVMYNHGVPVTAQGSKTVFSANGATHTVSFGPGFEVIDGTTVSLDPNQKTIMNGVTYSLGPSGIVVDGAKTISLVPVDAQGSETVFSADGAIHTVSFGPGSEVIDGTTMSLSSGEQTVVNGVTYSMEPPALIVDGTKRIPGAAASQTVFSADGATHTVSFGPSFEVIDGTTVSLSLGRQTVVDGVTYSLVPSALIVDGTKTIPIPGQAIATTIDVQQPLNSHDPAAGQSASAIAPAYTGGAGVSRGDRLGLLIAIAAAVTGMT